MMKRILSAMSLSIFMVVLVNAEQKDIPMKSDKKRGSERFCRYYKSGKWNTCEDYLLYSSNAIFSR